MSFTTCAWLWLYAGAALMLLELLAPGFVIFFFGLAAATVAFCRWLLGDSFTLAWQLAAFSGFSILYLVVLRRQCQRLFCGESERSDADLQHEQMGRLGSVTEAVMPPAPGRVLVGDAEWTAVADSPLAVGVKVTVVEQKNLTLKVRAI